MDNANPGFRKALAAAGIPLDDLLDWFVKLEELSFTHAALTKDQRGDVESLCAMFGVTPGMNCTPEEFKPTDTELAEKESKEAKDRAALAAHYETVGGVDAVDRDPEPPATGEGHQR